MKFKNIIGIVAVLFFQGVNAQFYVGVQSGIGNIQNDVSNASTGNRLGVAIKAGYVYPLTAHFGIGTGLEFSQYRQYATLSNSESVLKNYEVDESTSAFEYNITTKNYNEKQTLHAIQMPLFLQYKTNINTGIDFNFRAGAKYFLPINYKIKATADMVKGVGYYPDYNLNVEDLPEYGFGSQTSYSATGKYDTKGVFMSTFELGFTFDMGPKSALYTAMTLDYGYGSFLDQKEDKSYIGYNPTSVIARDANGLYSTDKDAKLHPVAFGVTLAWNFK